MCPWECSLLDNNTDRRLLLIKLEITGASSSPCNLFGNILPLKATVSLWQGLHRTRLDVWRSQGLCSRYSLANTLLGGNYINAYTSVHTISSCSDLVLLHWEEAKLKWVNDGTSLHAIVRCYIIHWSDWNDRIHCSLCSRMSRPGGSNDFIC